MKNSKEHQKDLEEKRNIQLEVLSYVFDKSFPDVFNNERIE